MTDHSSGDRRADVAEERRPETSGDAEVEGPPKAGWATRRGEAARSVIITVLAVVAALVIGAIAIALSDREVLAAGRYLLARPADTLFAAWQVVSETYMALLRGSLGSPRALSETVVSATPLVLAGLGVALAFRAGLFNIGAEGQLLLGGVAAGLVGFGASLPAAVHLPLAVVAGFAGGAAWGAVPGWLKARTGAHEVITTIMLNYVAFNLTLMVLKTEAVRRPGRTDPISQVVLETARLPALVPGLRMHAGILVALLAAAAVAWLLYRSTVGFEFRAVGLNPTAARTAGMSVEGSWTLAMATSGGLAGLAGAAQLLGLQYTLAPGFSAGLGFDAITVALLGRGEPVGTVLAGLLFGALRAGGLTMQATTGTPIDLIVVLQALIILFIAAPALVRAIFRIRVRAAADQRLSKGWAG